MGAVVPCHSIANMEGDVYMTMEVLAAVLQRNITDWNEPRVRMGGLAELIEGDSKITVVRRNESRFNNLFVKNIFFTKTRQNLIFCF